MDDFLTRRSYRCECEITRENEYARGRGRGEMNSAGNSTETRICLLQEDLEDPRTSSLRRISYGIILPAICCLGIIGNILNLVVLTRRNMRGTAYIYMRGRSLPPFSSRSRRKSETPAAAGPRQPKESRNSRRIRETESNGRLISSAKVVPRLRNTGMESRAASTRRIADYIS